MVCRKCGARLRRGDKYCSQCGTKVAPDEGQTAKSPAGSASANGSSAKKSRGKKDEAYFRTNPENAGQYRENFEDVGEDRFHAFYMTVTILALIALFTALFSIHFFFARRAAVSAGKGSGGNNVIEILDGEGIVASSGSDGSLQVYGETETEISARPTITVLDSSGNEIGELVDGRVHLKSGDTSELPKAEHSDGADQSAAGSGTDAGGEALTETAPEADAAAAADTGSEAGTETVSEEETETETGTETETETESETDPPGPEGIPLELPSPGKSLDTSTLYDIIISESSADSVAISVIDLDKNLFYSAGDDSSQMSASALITVPILYCAAAKLDAGEVTMDTEIDYVNSSGGRGDPNGYLNNGTNQPLSYYLQTMVRYSDNNCMNRLIDYFGTDAINAAAAADGLTSVSISRKIGETGSSNLISARDLSLMVRNLWGGRFQSIGREFMEEYFRIDSSDTLPTIIGNAAGVADADVFMNQNGSIPKRYNETSMIIKGNRRIAITVMLGGPEGFYYADAIQDMVNEAVNELLAN